MPTILLTGATGFIGRHCVEPLRQRGWDVIAVTSGDISPMPEAEGVSWEQADLLAPGEAARLVKRTSPESLLHLAWKLAAGSTDNYHWTRASLELLLAFAEAGGRRAVLAGSCAEYDWMGPQPLAEGSSRRPATNYGLCKNALGELVESFRLETGLSAAWARLFFLYGPGEAPGRLVASVVRSLLAGEEAKTSHGAQLRDYLYVEDAADALAALVSSEVEGPINVAAGASIRLKQLISRAASQLDAEGLVRLGAIEAHPEEAPEVSAEVDRLRSELVWQPRFSHSEGMARTIEWWRAKMEETDS